MGSKTFTGGRDFSARLYDKLCRWVEKKGLLAARKRSVGDLTGTILEIGAGTGLNLEHYPAGAKVIASEYDPVMLKRAQPRAAEASADVELLVADAMRLPVADGSVDAVVAGLMLCSVPDQQPVLEEMKRVLKPGGVVRFVEHVRAEDGTFLAKVQDFVNPAWRRISGGCNANRKTVEAFENSGFTVTRKNAFMIGRLHTSPHVEGEAKPL